MNTKTRIWRDGVIVGVKFAFDSGEEFQVMFEDFTGNVRNEGEFNGFAQTLGDAYSSGKSNEERIVMFKARLETLKGGVWKKGSRDGGGQADEDLAEALAIVTGKSLDYARRAVAEGSKEWKKERREHPKVKAELARIKAERLEQRAGDAEGVDDLI